MPVAGDGLVRQRVDSVRSARWWVVAFIGELTLVGVGVAVVQQRPWRRFESDLSYRVHSSFEAIDQSVLGPVASVDKYAYAVLGVGWLIWSAIRRQFARAAFVCASCVVGWLLLLSARAAFDWHRPPDLDALGIGASWQFPSGHAFGAALVAMLVSGAVSASRSPKRLWWAAGAWTWASAVMLLKLVQGNHYLGDLLVGGLLGAAWASGALAIAAWAASHRRISGTR